MYLEKGNETLAATFLQGIQGGWEREGTSDSGHDIRWLNYLITTLDLKTVQTLRNVSHIPNETNIANGFQDAYRRLFDINLRLYADTIFGPRDPLPQFASAKINVIVDRVKIRLSMFNIAVAILVTMIWVLVAIYWRQRQTIGHVPVSLAGMYALLYTSNAQEECGEMVGNTPQKRATRLKKFGAQYLCTDCSRKHELFDSIFHSLLCLDGWGTQNECRTRKGYSHETITDKSGFKA